MITGELKNKIDSLWDVFAAGGLVNPLDVIEQITYLMFIRDLDDSDNLRAKESAMLGLPYKSIFAGEVTIGERKVDGSQLKWSVFRDFPAGKMYSTMQEWVFPFIKNLDGKKDSAYSKYMDDAIFKLPTPLLLSKVVDALDEIYALMAKEQDKDVRGDTYEYLLNKIAQSGLNGQFRTPRHIIKMMVEMMQPKADDVICDPACGTSGFLVTAGEYLKENLKEEIFFDRQKKDHYMNHMFFGYDMDRTMLRIGAMNMMTHGVEHPFIEYRDSLSDQNPDKDKYSLILANPPFKGSLDYDTVSTDLLKVCKTKKTELLFLGLFLRMLRIGGRCACIVPDGVLFGSSTAHKAIRKEIIENNRLEAVISMPSGVFKPYAGVSTGILIFTKTGHGGTDNVWFYDMQADGFSLDDKRSPVAENDIPDIIARFHSLAQKGKQNNVGDGAHNVPPRSNGKQSNVGTGVPDCPQSLDGEQKNVGDGAHDVPPRSNGKQSNVGTGVPDCPQSTDGEQKNVGDGAHDVPPRSNGKQSNVGTGVPDCPQSTDGEQKNVGDGAHDVPFNEAENPRTAKSFTVPKEEIVQNDYDLSINKYKKTEYKAVEYAPTSEILAEINELEMKIQEGLKELDGMLK